MNVKITDIDGRKPSFVQWDVDRVLYISGCESQPCLHFANRQLTRAIVVEAEADGSRWVCRVPNFILQYAEPMLVSVFVQPDEGKTVLMAWFPVTLKMKPQDYSYEENIGYTNWVVKSAEAEELLEQLTADSEHAHDLVEEIQSKLERGELDGEDGNSTWTFASADMTNPHRIRCDNLVGRETVGPAVGDIAVADGRYVYQITGIVEDWAPGGAFTSAILVLMADIKGDKGATGATGPQGPQGPGVTEDLRAALLQLAQKVAYIDEHGSDYYQDLYDALYPSAALLSISATFTQGSTVVYENASLDSLKPMLYVEGHYDDNTDAKVTGYTLSGYLTAGTSTVTVSYLGKTDTFTVTVTATPTLSSISAVYTQSGTVYDTDTLDSLKANLVVTAVYSDSSTQTVAAEDYTLSGTLTAGTSTITVSYSEKTTTFTVVVTEYVTPKDYEVGNLLYNWDFTQSLTDSVAGKVITLNGNASQGSDGLTIPDASSYASIPSGVVAHGRIVELDIASTNAKFGNVLGRFLTTNGNDRGVTYRYNTTWNVFTGQGWSDNSAFQGNLSSKNAFSGTLFTVSFVGNPKLYKNGVLMGTSTVGNNTNDFSAASIGASANAFYEATITAMRVYEGVN